jgi:hypothetical protein
MDEADRAAPEVERALSEALRRQAQAAQLAPGVAGECDLCGEHTQRLINGACAPCRDRYKLP